MYTLKSIRFFLFCGVLAISGLGCDDTSDHAVQPQGVAESKEQLAYGNEGSPTGSNNLPYPKIIKKTFIPQNVFWASMKCLTWKITWPIYPTGTNQQKVPTVFKLSNGALNSIYFLNNVHQQNTLSANFSLFYNNKLEAVNTMWEELDYSDPAIESVYFYKTAKTAKSIEHWVKNRPQLFAQNWVITNQTEVNYQAGDIFLFKLVNQNRFGAIRIVSMSPRIIEVYLAVPNV